MKSDALKTYIESKTSLFRFLEFSTISPGNYTLVTETEPQAFMEACGFIKTDAAVACHSLQTIIAQDKKEGFILRYAFMSFAQNHTIIVLVQINNKTPRISSIASLFPSADFLEREIHDLFGIVFENRSDEPALLLPAGLEGYPLRKDYVNNNT